MRLAPAGSSMMRTALKTRSAGTVLRLRQLTSASQAARASPDGSPSKPSANNRCQRGGRRPRARYRGRPRTRGSTIRIFISAHEPPPVRRASRHSPCPLVLLGHQLASNEDRAHRGRAVDLPRRPDGDGRTRQPGAGACARAQAHHSAPAAPAASVFGTLPGSPVERLLGLRHSIG